MTDDQRLIERIRRHIQNPRNINWFTQRIENHVATRYPPATQQAVASAEAEIGFRLPELIREIYFQIGNGGFGPGDGIIGVEGGYQIYGATLAQNTLDSRDAEVFFAEMGWYEPDWHWSPAYIMYCYWGCNVTTLVDCSDPSLPVYSLDSTVMTPHSSHTLRQWWEDWLDGKVNQY